MGKSQKIVRRWAVLTCSAGLFALLTGCASGAPTATTTVTAEVTPTPTSAPEPVECTAEQLTGSFEMNPIVNFEFHNISAAACIIHGGYPTVEAVDLDGNPALPEAAQDDSWNVGVHDVTVEPGKSAWAVFSFGYQKVIPSSTLVEIGGFSVTLPESETVILVPYASGIWVSPETDNSLIIRPISSEREDTTVG